MPTRERRLREAKRLSSRKWRMRNPEKARLSSQKWRLNNPEKAKLANMRWRMKNQRKLLLDKERREKKYQGNGQSICNVCGVNTWITLLPSFTLPEEETRRKMWLDVLERTSSTFTPVKPVSYLLGSKAGTSDGEAALFNICGRHFLPSMFNALPDIGDVGNVTLKDHAVPLLVNFEDWNRMFEYTSTGFIGGEEIGRQQYGETIVFNSNSSQLGWYSTVFTDEEKRMNPESSNAPNSPVIIGGHGELGDFNYLPEPTCTVSWTTQAAIPISPIVSEKENSEIENGIACEMRVKMEPSDTSDTMDDGWSVPGISIKVEEAEQDDMVNDSGDQIDPHQPFVVNAVTLAELFTICRTPDCGKPVPSSTMRTSRRDGRISFRWQCSAGHHGEWSLSCGSNS